MKKITICLLVILAVSSCTIKEKMIMNEDGSGSFSYGFDMSGMFKMGMKSSDSTKKKQVVDTAFSFKELFDKAKDSIAKLPATERAMLKLMENFKISMKINEEKKQFEYNMIFDYKSLDSIQNMASSTETLEKLALSDKKRLGALSAVPKQEEKNTADFKYDGNVFIKSINKVQGNNKSGAPAKKKKKEKAGDDPFSKQMDEMLKECKYSMEYHFPKKIKTVSLKNAVISEDRKSFVVDVPLENLEDSAPDLGFKVVFEN
jgi:hypothetical protein